MRTDAPQESLRDQAMFIACTNFGDVETDAQ